MIRTAAGRDNPVPHLALTILLGAVLTLTSCGAPEPVNPPGILVFMTDFGLAERFVASMKGVALTVDPDLRLHDLTHDIEPYDIWQASRTLAGTIEYWPPGTVFVAVVDPGVGTGRKSVVARTGGGHYVVSPDNGSLTHVAERFGIEAVREIDETRNRRPGSTEAHTFHGRDVYAYTGARLAAGVIAFEEVGPERPPQVVRLAVPEAAAVDAHTITGTVTGIERPFGNVVTNIPAGLFTAFGLDADELPSLAVEISRRGEVIYSADVPYARSFGHVPPGQPLLYLDSVGRVGLALNMASFAETFRIRSGPDWRIRIEYLSPRPE